MTRHATRTVAPNLTHAPRRAARAAVAPRPASAAPATHPRVCTSAMRPRSAVCVFVCVCVCKFEPEVHAMPRALRRLGLAHTGPVKHVLFLHASPVGCGREPRHALMGPTPPVTFEPQRALMGPTPPVVFTPDSR